jgi:hypothetical protein
MSPVNVIVLPHNFRDELYPEGEGPSFCYDGTGVRPAPVMGGWATLPIPMPRCLVVTTDRDGETVIAATADGQQIRWKDLDIVVLGVRQYNQACLAGEPEWDESAVLARWAVAGRVSAPPSTGTAGEAVGRRRRAPRPRHGILRL